MMGPKFYLEASIKVSGERLGYMGASTGNFVEFWGYGEPDKTPDKLDGHAYKLIFSNEGGHDLLMAPDHNRYVGGDNANGEDVSWKLRTSDAYGVQMVGDELWMIDPDNPKQGPIRAMCFNGYGSKKMAIWRNQGTTLDQTVLSFKKIPV